MSIPKTIRPLFLTLALTIILTAPIAQTQAVWVSSYETVGFDTPTGDLSLGEYARDGTAIYIREATLTKPRTEGQFIVMDESLLSRIGIDLRLLNQVNIVCHGCKYYDEFLDPRTGTTIREESTRQSYDRLRTERNAPQPSRTLASSFLQQTSPVQGAISFDASSTSGAQSGVSSYSWSHTIAAGSERTLVVGNGWRDGSANTISGITYNSDALTEEITHDHSTQTAFSSLWYRVAPDTGTNTIAVTFTGTIQNGASCGSSYQGVDQTDPTDVSDSSELSSGNNPTITTTLTTTVDDAWLVDTAQSNDEVNASIAADGTQTEDCNEELTTSRDVGVSHKSVGASGNHDMSWDRVDSGNRYWTHAALALTPFVAAGAPSESQFIWITKPIGVLTSAGNAS